MGERKRTHLHREDLSLFLVVVVAYACVNDPYDDYGVKQFFVKLLTLNH